MSTKEKILETALTLFAKNGYDGTSVEQIAQDVGIKAPSLYKHFKGKADILNPPNDNDKTRNEESIKKKKKVGTIPENIDGFIHETMKKVRFTMTDPIIKKMRIFLVQEQFRSERLAEITTRHQVDGLLQMYKKILETLMAAGVIVKDDPEMLATEITAPVALWISKVDRQPKCEKEALKFIEKHLQHFFKTYKK